LIGFPGLECTQKCRLLNGHVIARIDEDLAKEIQGLLGAVRDQDLIRVNVEPVLGHHLRDQLAQRLIAFGRAVLKRRGSVFVQDLLRCLVERLHRKDLRGRQPSRE